jgi:hypothetical protein
MIDERDPAVALQAAMFTACSGSAALQAVAAGGVRIFDRVSASVFPFVRIGEDMVDADDSACGSVSEVFSTVRAYSRRPGLVEVKRLAAVLQDLLDMRTGSLEVDGFRVVVGYCDGISFERHADGLTTQAVVNFRYRLAPVPTSKALEGAGLLDELIGTASASVAIKATAAATLGELTGSASAAVKVKATAAATLGDLVGAASAAVKVKATAAATLGDLVGAASAAAAIQATAAGTLGDLTGAASAAVKVKATAAATLGDLVGAGSITAVAAGPTFESGVIHAWNPDAGADASGIIADAVGSANMWARDDLSAATSWSGELAGEALVVDHADVTDFKIAAATLTFWMYENGGSPAYSPLVHLSNTGGPSTGDWRMSRNGATSDQQNYVYTGYDAGANGKNPRECPTGQWNLWTIRLGAGTWRVLGNSAVQLSSTSWVTASFAGNTRPLSLGSNEDISDHTGGVYSDFRGRFGDVRMWDKSLSDAEIAALYTAGRQSY